MSDFFTRMAAVADRLIEGYGVTATFSRRSGSFNTATGALTGGSTSSWTGKAAIFGYRQSEIDGSVVQSSDLRLLISPDITTAPEAGDTVTVAGTDYRVLAVGPLNPGGTVVRYEAQLRV